jgi:hypothetical protein
MISDASQKHVAMRAKNRGSGSQREATTHRERRPATTSRVAVEDIHNFTQSYRRPENWARHADGSGHRFPRAGSEIFGRAGRRGANRGVSLRMELTVVGCSIRGLTPAAHRGS